jgi:hypothetical protein
LSIRDVRIRPTRRADLTALGRLGALLVSTHHGFDPKRFIAATPRTERGYASFLGSQLEARDVAVLVAEENDTVIGYAYVGVEASDYMSLRGPAGVVLSTAARNADAQRLFARAGFRQTMIEMTRELEEGEEG